MTPQTLDSTLYSAFGQSEVSLIYTQLNQYYVVMEVAPRYWQSPEGLKDIYLPTGNGNVPLRTVATEVTNTAPLSINHSGLFPSVTVSFNLAPGLALSDATKLILNMRTGSELRLPFMGISPVRCRHIRHPWPLSRFLS